MKKLIVFFSLLFITLSIWYFSLNDKSNDDNQNITSKKETIKNRKTTSSSNKKSKQSKNKKSITKQKRKPASKIMPTKFNNRQYKFKDYSRLPPSHTPKKKKKDQQRIAEVIAEVKNEYFEESPELSTPAGEFYISTKLKAINKQFYDESMGTMFREVNQHILYNNEEEIDLKNYNPEGPQLVTMNKKTGKLGILTGKIILVSTPMEDETPMQELVAKYNLNILYKQKNIQTYYMELTIKDNLEQMLTNLRKEKHVTRVDLEIINHLNRPL